MLDTKPRSMTMDPLAYEIRRLSRWLLSRDEAEADEAVTLDTNLRAVKEQRSYFNRELPRWQQLAGQWGVFLASRTHSSLITESNEADRASEAP